MRKLLLLFAVLISAISASAENYILYTSSDGKPVTPKYTDVFGATYVSNTYENGQGKLLFDGEVTAIGNSAFYFCKTLTSVEIPNSVTTIGNDAFDFCKNLTSVEIPNSVSSIGSGAFSFCESLVSIELPNSLKTIANGLLASCKSLKSIEIPRSVSSIEMNAFCNCTSLTTIEIPNSVETIEQDVFCGCLNLEAFYGKFASPDHRCLIFDGELMAFAPAGITSYSIPNTVTKIKGDSFRSNNILESIVIPNSVTYIGQLVFEKCDKLKKVVLGTSVAYVDYAAFGKCESLAELISLNTTPPSCSDDDEPTFYYCPTSTCVLKVPASAVDAYKAAEGWSEFKNIVALTDEDYQTLGIEVIQNAEYGKQNAIYNLQGMVVSDGNKGIFIKKGKKVIVNKGQGNY